MDFQTLTRRELQSLCKLNKIPANITNVAMAEALQSLHTVVGIEEYLNVTQSEAADVVQSAEVFSPQTRCRTSTRQKVKLTETETSQNRTARRGSRQPPKEVEDSLKTPLAVSRTTRRLRSECEETEVLVENKYGTRRSTRLTEKKAAVSRVQKGAVKIDSILDQGNSDAHVEDICNAFEKLEVVAIEEQVNKGSDEISNTLKISNSSEQVFDQRNGEQVEDGDEVTTLKNSEVKVCEEASNNIEDVLKKDDQVCDLKPESDEVSKVLEVDLKQEFALQEHNPIMFHENESSGVGADLGLVEGTLCAETNDSTVASSMIIDNTENPIDEIIIIKDVEEMSENTVDETVNVTMTEEFEDFKPELVTENKMTDKSKSESPLLLSDVTRQPTHMTPIKKATPLTEEVGDRVFEVFTENNEKSDADLVLVQNQVTANPGHATPLKNASVVVSDDKENNVVEVQNIKKDENDKINANDMSIRQLKKLLKAMTLNSHNSKEESDDLGTKRTALQAVCENQMVVGGENEN